jgi:glycosyltransferase involved in cell wall biosynthesis
MNLHTIVAAGMMIIRRQGLREFLRALRQVLLRGGDGMIPDTQQRIPSLEIENLLRTDTEDEVAPTGVGVSVVIPVLNGAKDLVKLLPALNRQKGFSRVEVIVVDSGSSDDSVRLAEAYGATVIEIEKKAFSHSHARNVGAEAAHEEYILFTVHDALPPSLTWLHQMYAFLKKEHLAAVSCMEKPRIEADLFSRVRNWYHYKEILHVENDDKVLSRPHEQNPQSLRASAQVSNVACLIPRDVIRRYKFRGMYAEDLDLGLRLIDDGANVGVMSSTGVIHSHTRVPYYYLQRGYIDKSTLVQLLHEPLEAAHPDFEHFVHDIFFTLNIFTRTGLAAGTKPPPYSVDDAAAIITHRMTALPSVPDPPRLDLDNLPYLDARTTTFINRLRQRYYQNGENASSDGNLIKGVLGFMEITFSYMKTVYEVLDDALLREVEQLQYQYFVNLVGRYMAVWYAQHAAAGKYDLAPVKSELADNSDTWNEVSR